MYKMTHFITYFEKNVHSTSNKPKTQKASQPTQLYLWLQGLTLDPPVCAQQRRCPPNSSQLGRHALHEGGVVYCSQPDGAGQLCVVGGLLLVLLLSLLLICHYSYYVITFIESLLLLPLLLLCHYFYYVITFIVIPFIMSLPLWYYCLC